MRQICDHQIQVTEPTCSDNSRKGPVGSMSSAVTIPNVCATVVCKAFLVNTLRSVLYHRCYYSYVSVMSFVNHNLFCVRKVNSSIYTHAEYGLFHTVPKLLTSPDTPNSTPSTLQNEINDVQIKYFNRKPSSSARIPYSAQSTQSTADNVQQNYLT